MCAKKNGGRKTNSLLCVTQPRAAVFVVDLVYSHLECALIPYIPLSSSFLFTLHSLHSSLALSFSLSLTKQTINILLLLNTVFFLFKFWFKRLSSSRSLYPPLPLSFISPLFLLVVCNVGRKPVQTFVQAFARSRARRLNEPVSLSQRV